MNKLLRAFEEKLQSEIILDYRHLIANSSHKANIKARNGKNSAIPALQKPYVALYKHYDQLVCHIYLFNVHDNLSGTHIDIRSCKPTFLGSLLRTLLRYFLTKALCLPI